MKYKIYDDSKNYVCTVVKLTSLQDIKGLDNLKSVTIFGNQCLVGKETDLNELQLFFPSECQISKEFLSKNNLFRHSELNEDKTKSGFFEDSGRVKALKFKGVISTGFVIPVFSLHKLMSYTVGVGDEFNEIDGIEICKKYIKQREKGKSTSNPRVKTIDNIVDSRFAPEHFSTEHLLKNVHRLELNDYIAVTYKLHGTSARYYNTLVKKKLSILDRIAKFFWINVKTEEYNYVCASRKVLKSVSFEELPNKNHYYTEDLWTKVGKEYFQDKLNQGECVYCEIIGKDYTGTDIQHGYNYKFSTPIPFVYRISNINSQGVEVDLSYQQMKERASQLDLLVCPEYYYGTLRDFLYESYDITDEGEIEDKLNNKFYNDLLEQSSILDNSVVEEGFCIRKDKFPKPEIFKIKSKKFLLHEGALLDKKDVVDIEEEQVI